MLKHTISALLLVAGTALGAASANAVEITSPKAVVELFTSQGCHSCPPADKLVGEFSKEKEILALSWHVDYWDYLGWKDTFASKENTQRQYRYARALQERQVYTPQAVINGRTHTTGSRGAEIRKIVKYFSEDKMGMLVPIAAVVDDESLKISIDKADAGKDATLYMVFYNEQHQVEIARGENGGKTLNYFNTVGDFQPLGMIKADGLQMDYPIAEMKRSGYDNCALILQHVDEYGNPGPIVGALMISGL